MVNPGAYQASLLLRPYSLLTLCHFFYYAKNLYVNSVNASLQYANSVTAVLPLCQFSTLPFYSMIKNNMPFRRLLKDRIPPTMCHPFCPREVTYHVQRMSATLFNLAQK